MPLLQSVEHETKSLPILDKYAAYGCQLNALSVPDLFQHYEQVGFLYPEKRERLMPYLSEVSENWQRALRGGELILWVITYDDPETGGWASVASYRNTNTTWHTQHIVSMGGPMGSRSVLLAAQAIRIHDGFDSSHQGWFTITNRFPKKVFGSVVSSLGDQRAVVLTHNYVAAPLSMCREEVAGVHVVPCRQGKSADLLELALHARGPVYVEGEQLNDDDLELHAVDDLYRRVGLRRTRHVWLAYLPRAEQPAGAILAYRGPLGLNFSFIENRCDLILRPGLSENEVALVARALVHAAATAYPDFRPGFIPLLADGCAMVVLQQAGARFLRTYCQSIWLQSGYEAMYRHFESFYQRIEKVQKRRGLGVKTPPFRAAS